MMQTWFETKLKYRKTAESGREQMVTETFVLDAVSYTDAESRMIKQAQQMVRGSEFSVKDIKPSNVAEIFPYDDGEWWFKIKVRLVTVDEQAGKEKKVNIHYLIMADDAKEALSRLDESLSYMVIPYVAMDLRRTTICDVFPYDLEEGAAKMSAETKEAQVQ